MKIRFPWFTLYGNPNGRAKWRCVVAMLVHEFIFEPLGKLTGRSEHVRPNRWTVRYAIGSPVTYPPQGLRGTHFVIGSNVSFPSVVDGAFLFVTDDFSVGTGAMGSVVGMYRGNASKGAWEPVGNQTASVHLDTAAINTLHSAPTQIVPPPGAGKALVVVNATFEYEATSGQFYDLAAGGLFWTDASNVANAASADPLAPLWHPVPNVSGLVVVGPVRDLIAPIESIVNAPLVVGELEFNPAKASPIVTATIDAVGSGYAPGDTGTIGTDSLTGDNTATYIVNTVDGDGGVTDFTVTAAGSDYTSVSSPIPTATGGSQPGSGTGFTVNVSDIPDPEGDLYVTVVYRVIPVHLAP